MNSLKSHFLKLNKRQRRGILFLSLLIILLQLGYYFVDFKSKELEVVSTDQEHFFNIKIDSIKQVTLNNKQPKIYPFNPNFLTDFRASKLGMSVVEIDRLFAFRKKGKYVNSAKEFQKVTKISDSLLKEMKPFFKFPEWVTNPKKRKFTPFNNNKNQRNNSNSKSIKIADINTVTANELQQVNGIGQTLSARIIKYRTKLGGFYFKDQLNEVYGLSPEVIEKINKQFQILTKPKIKKVNINEASFKQILHLPYINYELTKKILDYRDEFAEFQSLNELKKIEGFPIDKYDRIILYLSIN